MTHREAISISVFFTFFGLEGAETSESTRGSRSCWGEDAESNTRRKTEKEGQRVAEGERGVALSLLSVTQLPALWRLSCHGAAF